MRNIPVKLLRLILEKSEETVGQTLATMEESDKEILSCIQEMLAAEVSRVEEISREQTLILNHTRAVDVANDDLEASKDRHQAADDNVKSAGKKYIDGAVSMGFLAAAEAENKLVAIRSADSSAGLPPVLKQYMTCVASERQCRNKMDAKVVAVRQAEARVELHSVAVKKLQSQIRELSAETEALQQRVLAGFFPPASASSPSGHSGASSVPPPDKFRVQEICRTISGIPSSLRLRVWPVLLGVDYVDDSALTRLAHNIRATQLDLKTQRIIKADVVRTRQTIPFFREDRVKALMEQMLTFYCKRRSVAYTQVI